ncbi:hypothetical protein F5Y00DRAFT_274590 [Daldinia vernicosa]|uniref:uncharacterized protein n=1 Tax=Daldinia vernicosa TaxID=114800 RepID=UPI002007BE91|nr:uncharacterized protein F5Y00DRAFT_274590 [Daldinia vernicosa]KAI0851682.1 hypothetical protein F5Y00DRAFT_274590 [Daldinia vernicosa]
MANISRWGIKSPQDLRPLSWEAAKDDLEQFLKPNPNDTSAARLAHVEGPHGSGKSTGMIEFIWEKTHTSDRRSVVIYVPALALEALMLSAYFETTASPHEKLKYNICVGLENLKPMLHLATATQLRTALRGALRTHTPHRLVLLIDLELSPTADGELLLSELVKWHRGLTPDCHLTLITMAAFTRPPVHKFWEACLNTKCRHITFSSTKIPALTSKHLPLSTIWWQESDENLPTLILDALRTAILVPSVLNYSDKARRDIFDRMAHMKSRMKDLDGTAAVAEAIKTIEEFSILAQGCILGPCVVVVQNDEDNNIDISDMLYNDPMFVDVLEVRAGPKENLTDWLEAIIYPGPKVVYVEADTPVVLYLPRVTAIISLSTYASKSFDHETCALTWASTQKSRMELLKEQSYARKTSAPTIPTPTKFYYVSKDDGRSSGANFDKYFDEWTLAPPAPAYEGQFVRLCFEVCAPWPDDKDLTIPLPAVSSLNHMARVWESLINMGCLSRHPKGSPRPVLNGPRARRTLDFLDSEYNEFGTVPLAFQLAGIHDAQSDAVKRVLIRIASFISEGPFAVYFSELIENKRKELALVTNSRIAYGHGITDIHQIVAGECVGIGKQEFDRGAIWIILGLFLRAEASLAKGQDLEAQEKGYNAGIDLESFDIIIEKVRGLESMHGIQPSQDPVRDTELSPEEVSYIMMDLMKVWSSQLVYFKRKSGMTCRDLTSCNEVNLNGFPHINVYGLFDRDTSPVNDVIFAFYTDLAISQERRWVFNLTRVPTESVVELIRKEGHKSLVVY